MALVISGVTWPATLPGTPTTSDPGGITLSSETSAPAATREPAPTTDRLSRIEPMPIKQPSSIVAPCTTARWPTTTRRPIETGTSVSTCTTELSWMFDSSPSVIESMSPRRTAPNHTLERAPRITSPTTTAPGATNAVASARTACGNERERAMARSWRRSSSDDIGLDQKLVALEALDRKLGDVDGALAVQDEACDHLAYGRRVHEAVPAEAVRALEALEAGHRSQDRVVVGRGLVEARPPGTVLRFFERRNALHGEREHEIAELEIDVRVEGRRLLFVGLADQDAARLAVHVHAALHVDDHGKALVDPGQGLGGEHLTAVRGDGKLEPGPPGGLGREWTSRVHDRAGRDLTLFGEHALHAAALDAHPGGR